MMRSVIGDMQANSSAMRHANQILVCAFFKQAAGSLRGAKHIWNFHCSRLTA